MDPLLPGARPPAGSVRARAADGGRIDVQESRIQLLPDQPRPRERRGDDRAVVPGRAHPVRQVPQSSIRAVDPGRLLRLRGLLLADRAQEGQPARRGGGLRLGFGRRASAQDRPEDAAEGPGRPGLRRFPPAARPPRSARLVAVGVRQSLLRPEPGEPDLVPPDGPGDRGARGRFPRLQSRLERRAAGRPHRGLRQGRIPPQAADPDDPPQPDLPAQRDDQLAECGRRPLLLALPDQALAGGGPARRDLDGDGHHDDLRRPPHRRPRLPDP